MSDTSFDATITLGHHHLRAAGLDPQQDSAPAVNAVRRAVARMEGANWIDVVAADFSPAYQGWVIVYPRGNSMTPDTLAWRERRHGGRDGQSRAGRRGRPALGAGGWTAKRPGCPGLCCRSAVQAG